MAKARRSDHVGREALARAADAVAQPDLRRTRPETPRQSADAWIWSSTRFGRGLILTRRNQTACPWPGDAMRRSRLPDQPDIASRTLSWQLARFDPDRDDVAIRHRR